MSLLEGNQILQTPVSGMRVHAGLRVKYLRHVDIDKSGRGYFFPQSGILEEVQGRSLRIDNVWYSYSEFAEMVLA